MNLFTVGQFKSKFSEMLTRVLQGESIGITFGKNKQKVAALVPYSLLIRNRQFKLGLLQGKASFKILQNFKITDKELLSS